MRTNSFVLGVFFAALTIMPALAQENDGTANTGSGVHPIPKSDVMYRKTIWRTLDLREKQNKPMFAANHQITKIIIEAVKRGELVPFRSDSLSGTYTLDDFNKKLIVPEAGPTLSEEEKKLGFTEEENSGGDWGDETKAGGNAGAAKSTAASSAYEYLPKQLYQLELKEDLVFDKKRSRMYHEIQSLTLIIPAGETSKGLDLPVATFKYADLMKVFRNNPEAAIWFNGSNTAQHRNLADAFELWLFSSYITKVSNPDDKPLSDIYGGDQQGILAAQQVSGDLIEYEYNLWSY